MKRIQFIAIAALACQSGLLSAQTAPQAASDNVWQPTGELNKELHGWLKFSGSYRTRVEEQNGIAFKDVSDTHILGQLQFGVRVQPASWVSFFGQAQDSHIYLNGPVPKAPPYQNTWDLHQAWAELGNADRYHIKLRVGRQELNFGDQRLIGVSPWLNSPRVFDAALASVFFAGSRVDAFTSSVVNSVDGPLDHHKQGNPLHGIYGSFPQLVHKATLEPYLFWRLAPPGYGATYASGQRGRLDEKTFGVRIAGKLPAQFDYAVEMARQTGSLGANSIGAWAGHWGIGRSFAATLKPRVLADFNYASGTADPAGTKISTFDQLYPTGHDKFGLTDQVGWRNIRDLRTGIELKPSPKLNISGIYHNLWLANAHDGLYAANGAVVARSLAGVAGTHIGQELDLHAMFKYNKAIQIGAGYGHLFVAEFLKSTTPGKSYNFPYALLTYAF